MGYSLGDFRAAQARIKGLVRRTPMMATASVLIACYSTGLMALGS